MIITCLALGLVLFAGSSAGQSLLPCTVAVPPTQYPGGSCVFSLPDSTYTDPDCSRFEQLFAESTGIYGGTLYIYKNGRCGVSMMPATTHKSR